MHSLPADHCMCCQRRLLTAPFNILNGVDRWHFDGARDSVSLQFPFFVVVSPPVSAGGAGTLLNVDWLADTLGRDVIVRGAPIAGWFFPGDAPDQVAEPLLPPSSFLHFEKGTSGGIGHSRDLGESRVDGGHRTIPLHSKGICIPLRYSYSRSLDNLFASRLCESTGIGECLEVCLGTCHVSER